MISLDLYNYWIYVILMMIGLYAVLAKQNLIKKIVGLGIFQTAVFLFYISIAFVKEGTVPIIWDQGGLYVNPLPHVLILTAIVVSVSTMAVALGLIICIKHSYNSIEADEIDKIERNQ